MVNLLEVAHVVQVLDSLASPQLATRALRDAGLTRDMLRQARGYIPYASIAVMAESAARSLGDRHLGLRVGQRFDYGAYDGYADYVLSAPYLGAALVRGRRALPFIHPGSDLILQLRADHLILGFSAHIDQVLGYRHISEASLFVIIQVFRHFIGPDWHPCWIDVTDDASGAVSLLEDGFGAPVRAGAPYTALAVRTADLRRPNPDPARLRSGISLPELACRMGGPAPRTMTDTVLQQFLMRSPTLTQDDVARILGLGPRSLQRALQQEGTRFRDLRARHLQDRAKMLLASDGLSIDAVARRLGYTEPNSFRRAFHGWTGQSPSDYRRTQTPGSPLQPDLR